jgi:hypothetical protein
MLEDALLDLSNRGDLVCRAVEVDPLYVDVIARRYEAATGNLAVLAQTGEAFEAVAARRASETATV